MKTRRLLILLAATVALALATIGVALAAPGRQAESENETNARPASQERAYLGLTVRPLTDRVREYFGLPDDFQGVVVTGVDSPSPAHRAGMHLRDVVYRANGHDITEPQHLTRLVNSMSPGDVLTLQYVRQGERGSVDIVLGKWSDYHQPPVRPNVPEWLRKLHGLLNLAPNMVDATINVLGEDGAVHQYVVTPGSLVRLDDAAIAVTKRDGQTSQFRIGEDVVVVKHGRRVRLADLELHDRIVVVQKDGVVKALVVGLLSAPGPAPLPRPEARPVPGPQVRPNMPEVARERIEAVQERLQGLSNLENIPMEKAIEQLEAMKERHPELAERIDQQIAKLRERMAHLQQTLERRAANASQRQA